MDHLIVGIDSGKRSAVACIDLSGDIVHLATGTFVGLGWFVDNIKKSGSPVIIASDKKRPSQTASKLAAIFSALLFTSGYDISVRRKQEMTSRYNVASLHERDALSAALTAYNAYQNKLNQADVYAKRHNILDRDKVKTMIIKRYSMHEAMSEKIKIEKYKRT